MRDLEYVKEGEEGRKEGREEGREEGYEVCRGNLDSEGFSCKSTVVAVMMVMMLFPSRINFDKVLLFSTWST